MTTAFFGEPTLKAAVLERLHMHRQLDQFVQKIYFKKGRGCHLGCMTHRDKYTQEAAGELFGIPLYVAHLLEAVFEGLDKKQCAWWAIASIEAIPVGADLSLVHHELSAWLLGPSGLLAITADNRAVIERVRGLCVRAAAGSEVSVEEWFAARKTAWLVAESTANAARSFAWSAANSAADAVRAAAWAAAERAAIAAWSSAAPADEFAVWSDATADWKKIADKSLEIFAACPVVGQPGECQECVEATMAHLSCTGAVVV